MSEFGEKKLNRLHHRCLAGALVLVGVVGALFTGRSWQQAETWMHEDLLDQAQLIARSVPLADLKALSGTEADLDSPVYQRLKSQLAAVKQLDECWAWLYLMGRRSDGAIFFLLDSEDDGAEDASPAGQVYMEATPLLHRVFDTGQCVVEGPETDRWGTWISPLVPIVDPQTGKVLAVFGIDVEASLWRKEVLEAGVPALVASLFLLVLLLLVLVLHFKRGMRVRYLRHLEVSLVVTVGVVLTISVVWRSRRQDERFQQVQFARLATVFSSRLLGVFHDLNGGGGICGPASIFYSSDWVSAAEFAEFSRRLGENPAVRSWCWVPEIPESERAGFEEAMRSSGLDGFSLWEQDGEERQAASVRETHYPVAYSFPDGAKEGVVGFDLASDPRWLEVMEEARFTGLIAASEPLPHPGQEYAAGDITILMPVGGGGDGRQHGFVQATLDMRGLMQVVASSMLPAEAGPVALVEFRELHPDQTFVPLAGAGNGANIVARRHAWASHVQPVFAFGRVYALISSPGPGFLAMRRGSLGFLSAVFGLVVTFFSGMLVALLGYHREYLEEVVAERTEDLQTSIRRFDQLGTHAHTFIWETDAAGLYTYMSRNVSAILGYEQEEIVGRLHYYDLHPDEGREEFRAAGQDVFERRDSFRAYENPIRTKDGGVIWVSTDGLPMLDREGRLLGYRGSDRDITEQRQIRERERFRRRFDEMLAHVAADFVITPDEEFGRALDRTLGRIGELFGTDRAHLFQAASEAGYVDNTNEWCAPGVSSQKENNQHLCPTDVPWLVKGLMRGRTVWLADVQDISAEDGTFREFCRRRQIRALVCLPLGDRRGGVVGFLGMSMASAPRRWSAEEVTMLEALAGVLAGAIDRQRTLRELAASESALRTASSRLEFILEATNTSIDIIDRDYVLRHVDKRWQQIYGDPVGRKCYEYFMGLEEPCKGCAVRHAIDHRTIVVSEHTLCREGGRIIEVHSIPFEDDNGEWLVAEFNIDITKRKQAESELQETLERYRLLADYTDDFVAMYTHEGELLYLSPSYYRKTGWSEEEVRSGDRYARLHPDDLPQVESMNAANRAGLTTSGEYRIRCKDGSWLWVDSQCKPLPDSSGGVGRILVWSRDITERKQVELEQAKLREQLIQSQKMESVGRLAGGVAHDFNNMLQAILGYAELALSQLPPGSNPAMDIEEVRSVAQRAAELTRQLLAFARKQTVSPKVLDLNVAVGDMLGMLRRLLGEHIGLVWMPGAGLWSVKVDPMQVGMVLTNLCLNARDAMAAQGKIILETRNVTIDRTYCGSHAEVAPGDYVMLAVSDDGHGMDKATMAKIFEPFFTTKEVGKGTGLGLSTVHGIALQNGGFVNVYSELGEGSTFRFYLPRYRGGAGGREDVRPTAEQAMLSGGRETVLVAEDEPKILAVCREVLGRLGYTVLLAETPGRAIELAEGHKGPIHLLLTDVVMPEMDGRELAERVGRLRPGIPCVYMSGYTADAIAHHGMLDAGLEFLQKPFTNKMLTETVRRVLDGGREG